MLIQHVADGPDYAIDDDSAYLGQGTGPNRIEIGGARFFTGQSGHQLDRAVGWKDQGGGAGKTTVKLELDGG